VTSKLPLVGTLLLSVLSAGTAWAQSPARTGTDGDVTSTPRAAHTTSVGQTKPPGGAGGGEPDRNVDQRTPQQKKDNAITKGICIGCN